LEIADGVAGDGSGRGGDGAAGAQAAIKEDAHSGIGLFGIAGAAGKLAKPATDMVRWPKRHFPAVAKDIVGSEV